MGGHTLEVHAGQFHNLFGRGVVTSKRSCMIQLWYGQLIMPYLAYEINVTTLE